MQKERTIGGIPVGYAPFPIMPGAGIVKTREDLEKLLQNDDVEIIEMGAITVPERGVNPGNILYHDPANRFSVNSVGMNNLGKEKYKTVLPEMVKLAHARGKKLIVNIAAVSSYEEYFELLLLCAQSGADGVVLNCGCPNLWMNSKQHPPLSLHPEGLETMLSDVENKYNDAGLTIPVWVKLSLLIEHPLMMRVIKPGEPLPDLTIDPVLVNAVANVIRKFPFIKAVVCTNTAGQVQVLDENGKPVLGPNPNNPSSTGGLAGKAIHAASVTQARMFAQLYAETDIDVIGAGGVDSGETAYDFAKAGCKLVQVISEYHRTQDAGIFSAYGSDYFIAAEAHVGHI